MDFGNRTVVYSKPSCPHCVAAKQLLTSKGIAFEEIQINGSFTKEAMNRELGRTDLVTVPQIVLEGKFIPGGNSGLRKFYGL